MKNSLQKLNMIREESDRNAKINTKVKYKKVPPEGGWGYLVGIGMAISFVVALGMMPSFGLMFGDFIRTAVKHSNGENSQEESQETSAISLVTSSFFSALSFAGLFTNTLIRKTSCRFVGLVGASLYFTGSVMTIFVTSVTQLLISYSILQGAGFGFIIPVAYTTFNAYFVEKRVLMMSIAQTLIGVGSVVFPIATQKLMEIYGFRGCLTILAAVNAHTILGMLVMHPVEWHMKTIEVSEPHEVVPLTFSAIDAIKSKSVDDVSFKRSFRRSIPPRPSTRENPLQYLKDQESLKRRRASSIPSLGNWTGPVVVSDSSERDNNKTSKWQVLVDFLDLTLLKDGVYVNIAVGISLAHYSDVAFFFFQPMYLFLLDFTNEDTSYIIAIGAAADLVSRVFLAISSAFVSVKARYVYLAGALFTIIARFAFLCVSDFAGMAIITAILGFLRTWIHVTLPLVFAEHLSQERFPSGYGLFMFLQGNIMFIVGPIVGYIRDVTGSYVTAFHALSVVMAACVVPWLIEILYMRYQKKKTKMASPEINDIAA